MNPMQHIRYFLVLILISCSFHVKAQFQWQYARALRHYDGTTWVRDDSSYFNYYPSHLYTYDSVRQSWKCDTVTLYKASGAFAEKEKREYDAQGKMTLKWLDECVNKQWYLLKFTRYEYNTAGKIENEVTGFANASYDSMKYQHSYNSLGLDTEKISMLWDKLPGAWMNSSRLICTYNGNGMETEALGQDWVLPAGQWETSSRWTTTYGSNTKELMLEDYQNNSWLKLKKDVYTYNANGFMTMQESLNWNTTAWKPKNITTYYYNINNRLDSTIYREWDGNSYVNVWKGTCDYNTSLWLITTRYMYWDAATAAFIYKNGNTEVRDYYQWEGGVHDGPAYGAPTLSVYPVPAKGWLHIRANAKAGEAVLVNMMDMNGRLVKHTYLHPSAAGIDETIDVSGIPAGAYMILLNGMVQKVQID